MQSKVASLPDRSVRYLESGSGRPIVLLHAFPLSGDQWLPQLHRIPPGWRAIAPDLRGFRGAGSALDDPGLDGASMESHAADVLALMTHLEIDRAVIVGLSMGGYITFALMRAAPARVAGLVLANTRATPDSANGLAGRDLMMALAQHEGAAGVAREMIPKLIGRTTLQEQPDLAEAVRALIVRNSVAGLVSALRAMKLRRDATPLLAAVGCPTLIVAGEEDTLIPSADIAAMNHMIPGAAAVAIPRAGHLTNLEAPGAFNEALTRFLNQMPQGVL
jgi:pimeloyl-ACP methyl ester carboxylesterase